MGIFQLKGKVGQLLIASFILLSSSAYAQGIKSAVLFKNNPDGSQILLNHVPQAVAVAGQSSQISHAVATQMLDLRILLPSKNQAGLDSFIQDLYNPKSPNYHKFLTPQQFAQQFGASDVDAVLVKQRLNSYGLTLKNQSENGLILTVSAPVSVVEHTFNLHVNNYKKTDGTNFFAPDANPTIPTPIAGKVYAIIGLDNLPKYHPHIHFKSPPVAVKAALPAIGLKSSALPVALPAALPAFSGHGGDLGPSDIATAYNYNSVASNGTGQTLALYELDNYAASDITTFENFYSLPHVPLTNVLTLGGPGAPGASQDEDVLDIDLGVAVAPGLSSILVYLAPNTGAGWIDQWNKIATDDIAKTISCSWGLDEPEVTPYDYTVFSQLAAQGQSVFASSGDAGAYDNCQNGNIPPSCAGQALTVDDPASDPYVTGVGISILTANGNGTYNSERASLQGGGGISTLWTIPVYQQGLTLAPGSLVSTTMRNVPDVSFTADPTTLYGIYVAANGGWGGYWGSSAASPIWAAFISRVNQGRAAISQSSVGYLNPTLYQILKTGNYAGDFHDITTGNNSFYPAKTGYDAATGLGSFNGANLYSDLVGLAAPTGLIATPGNAQVALSWTASAGAVSYNVKRATVNGGPYTTISVSGAVTVTSYTDNTALNGTTYYYVVSAVNLSGESSNSSQVSAMPFIPTAPSAPLAVFAAAGNALATVSFSPPASNGGSPITLYTVTSNPGGFTGTGASSPIVVGGLTNGLSYTFTVTARNIIGTSVASTPSNSVIPTSVIPPSSLKGTILAARIGSTIVEGGVSLSWGQSASPNILQNKVYRAAGAGAYSLVATLSPSTAYTDKGLTKGIVYKYEVTAVSSLGESPFSNVLTINY